MLDLISKDKISENFNELYTYLFFLPENNKAELMNEVAEIIKDIRNNSINLEKIDSLYTYTFFLPENNKTELINEIDKLKIVIQKFIKTDFSPVPDLLETVKPITENTLIRELPEPEQ